MKALRLVLFVIAMAASSVAWTDDAARIEAEKLLDAMGMETLMGEILESTLDAQIKQRPELAPYKNVMLEFLDKYMSYKSLKPELAQLYADEFSASELKEIRAFYETPTGKRLLVKLPALMSKGAELGRKRVRENMPELQRMLKKEKEKIDAKENGGKNQDL
jgi:hypothetical protein